MPEPLANPFRRTATPSIVAVAVAPLGKVSVVVIARAAGSHLSTESNGATCGKAAMIFSAGGGSPITPVEEMNPSFGSQPNKRAVVAAVVSTTCLPARPVNVLELPELTTMPRTLPPGRHSRHHATGAPAVSERVKTPAIALSGASSASIKSSRPVYRIPQANAASRTPAIGASSGKLSGARGETAVIPRFQPQEWPLSALQGGEGGTHAGGVGG